jgi:hypothetical protein
MNSIALSCIIFLCISGGILLGMFLRNTLAEHHLSTDSKDVVRLGAGLIGTLAALVIGLLIATAKSSYDTQSTQIREMTASFILLDNLLAEYGPETGAARDLMRRGVVILADRMWHESNSDLDKATPFEASAASEAFYLKLLALSPQNDSQRFLQTRAIQVGIEIAQTRLRLYARTNNSIPMPFLVVLIFWLTFIFASFSLFSQPSPIVVGSLLIFALSAAGAIYLILDLSQPFTGLMQISSSPLRDALTPLGHP